MNNNIYKGSIQPNPKEYNIWVNDKGLIKTWNGNEWIELGSYNPNDTPNNNPNSESIDHAIEVTYAELKQLRNNAKLVPYQKYRMIDYETHTTQENTQSAGHPFDLILTALDEKTLNDECSATWSKRDTDGYFGFSQLSSWKIRYTMENTARPWGKVGGLHVQVDDSGETLTAYEDGILEHNGIVYKKYAILGNRWLGFYCLTQANTLNVNDIMLLYSSGWGVILREVTILNTQNKEDGKGIIYKMIDEWGNEASYDFKNIMYLYNTEDGGNLYVFTFANYYDSTNDMSVAYSNESKRWCAYGNKIYSYYYLDLPNIIMFDLCYDNIINDDCYNIVLNTSSNNRFGRECSDIKLMGWCNNNVFGGRNTNMTFKDGFQNMEIAYNSCNIIGEVGGTHYNKYTINAYGSHNNPIKLDSSIIEHGIIYVTMVNDKPVIYTSNDVYTAILATKTA